MSKRYRRQAALFLLLGVLGLLPLAAGAQVEEARARVDGMV